MARVIKLYMQYVQFFCRVSYNSVQLFKKTNAFEGKHELSPTDYGKHMVVVKKSVISTSFFSKHL